MAIAKEIAIHGGVKQVREYITNEEKVSIHSESNRHSSAVSNVLDYAENTDKTTFVLDGDEDILVSGYLCSPETAAIQFEMDKNLYHSIHGYKALGTKTDKKTGETVSKQEIDAYHIIQSFEKDATLDPRLVHKLGLEFAERAFPGHRCIVCTHMNTDHLHNHILECAYEKDGSRKLPMNKELRNAYRSINDDISIEYGLPILLETSQEQSRRSYYEWMMQRNGDSWKDALKNDIKEAASIAASWDEYLDIMVGNGYEIKDRDAFVTYIVEGAIQKNGKFENRRVRDKTLGLEFTKEVIERNIQRSQKRKLEHEREHTETGNSSFRRERDLRNVAKKNTLNLHINRYDNDGRYRSDLEIAIIRAIKLITHFMNKNWDPDRAEHFKSSPSWYPADVKLKAMEQTLEAVRDMDIKSAAELSERLNTTGAKLSHVKREIRDLEAVLTHADRVTSLIEKLKEYENDPDIAGFKKDKLFIPEFSRDEIKANTASDMPMTSAQRRELFIALQDSGYVLTEKYNRISYTEAKNTIDFLNGKTDISPEIIVDENNKSVKYRKMLDQERDYAKRQLSSRQIYPSAKKVVESIAKEKGLDVDIEKLNQYQATQIINCYGENPLSSPLIKEKPQLKEELQSVLKANKAEIGRDINFVTEKEANEILSYLNRETNSVTIPTLLKNDQPIRQSIAMQIEELLDLRGETCSVPIEMLSESEGYQMKNFLLYKGESPDLGFDIQNDQSQKLSSFISEIQSYPIDVSAKLCSYRDIVSKLASFGIDTKNMNDVLARQTEIIEEYKEARGKEKLLGIEYKNLRNLNYNLSLAQNAAFTNGPLYIYDDVEIGTEIVNERDTKYNQTKTEEQAKEQSHDRDYFDKAPELWFGRM